MSRLLRILLYGATGLVLLLGVLAAGLWIRSRLVRDLVVFTDRNQTAWHIESYSGGFRITRIEHWPAPEPLHWFHANSTSAMLAAPWIKHGRPDQESEFGLVFFSRGGCRAALADGTRVNAPLSYSRVRMAYPVILMWVFLLLCLRFVPTIARAAGRFAERQVQKRRTRHGLCPACGYDLRATPDPAGPRLPRCPECGREAGAPGAMPTRAPGDL